MRLSSLGRSFISFSKAKCMLPIWVTQMNWVSHCALFRLSAERIVVGLDPRLDFFAGTVAVCWSMVIPNNNTNDRQGMAGLVVGFPFDTGMHVVWNSKCLTLHPVKVRFQNPEIARKYSSTFHAVTTIIKEERFIGLFKGITSPLVFTLHKLTTRTPPNKISNSRLLLHS